MRKSLLLTLIFIALVLIVASPVAARETPPSLVTFAGDAGPSDVILGTNIAVKLRNLGYDPIPAMTLAEVDLSDIADKVVIVVYEGDVRIVIGEDATSEHAVFATNVADMLDDMGVENEAISSYEFDSTDLNELFTGEPEFEALLAAGDDSPTGDIIVLTNLAVKLYGRGFVNVQPDNLFSDINPQQLNKKVLVAVCNNRGLVIIGDNFGTRHTLFASHASDALDDLNVDHQVITNYDIDSSNVLDLFGVDSCSPDGSDSSDPAGPDDVADDSTLDDEPQIPACNGCMKNNNCLPIGYREDGEYCSASGGFVPQQVADNYCQNNFECSSNLCISNACVSEGLWQRFLDFISSWFS